MSTSHSMSAHEGQDTGRLKEKCRQGSFSPTSQYLLCHCAPHLPDAYNALVIAFLWLEAQTLTSFIFRVASALITMLCASLFSSQPLITTGSEPKMENDETSKVETGGRWFRKQRPRDESQLHRRMSLLSLPFKAHNLRFLNYLPCWPSNERIKIAPTRGLYHVHISPHLNNTWKDCWRLMRAQNLWTEKIRMPQHMLEIFQPALYETVIKNHQLRSMASQSIPQMLHNCTVISYMSVLVTFMQRAR